MRTRANVFRMNSEIAENAIFTHHSRMARPRNPELNDVWPKRARAVELLDAKIEALQLEGLDEASAYRAIADALGLKKTRSLEHEWRYDRSRRPGRNTLELAAPYFGVELWEIDGPDADNEFGNIMGIIGKNLSEETKAKMIREAILAQEEGRLREEAEKTAKVPE
jgi:transcriptional regulator with XRE-family HTH domain